ncbi:MAG: cation transporter [Bdellovibrionales bacterium]|nr:cation transporter [Bdellovibrionales bacterium]
MGHVHVSAASLTKSQYKKLFAAVILTAIFCVVEIVGSFLSHSLALASDAGHMFIDLAALLLVLVSAYLSQRPAPPQKTYGYYRLEILAAFLNGGFLLFIAFEILRSAFSRFSTPPEIHVDIMLSISLMGLLINLICMFLLKDHHHHLGARSAYYHVMSDFLSSIGAIFAAFVIAWKNWLWMDPLISVVIALLILWNAKSLIFESAEILLEGAPGSTPLDQIRSTLTSVNGIHGIHDLHVWTIGSGFVSATAHILVLPMDIRESEKIVQKAAGELSQKFGIKHSTFQVECANIPKEATTIQPESKQCN